MQIGNCEVYLLYGVRQVSDLLERRVQLEGQKGKLYGLGATCGKKGGR
jgi:hypothetical protein